MWTSIPECLPSAKPTHRCPLEEGTTGLAAISILLFVGPQRANLHISQARILETRVTRDLLKVDDLLEAKMAPT